MSVAQPNVVLRGCPSPYLAEDERFRHVSDPDDRLKFYVGNRYEHFVPTSEWEVHDGVRLRVFVWTGATKPAE
ncbi:MULTISPECIES: DUF5988 family protein [Streptomyces]|uniref:Uncharacterized protein n=2 Tax=Streptomyces chartreusis TaxID=1969 RepID=F8QZS5_STRCX|nr:MULTISPECIES: DUF5988 family protein [Streptomyces]AEH42495.1 hypothetical protein [Streptomyces chartreusis NRRL 3882]MYS92096.1 hypothetical protein [Streptomyces sp. SID5464]SOR83521.1 hypothetical protein SCNRRL3882_6967 [Streptomyces chartreusis NRRL 3882]